MMSGKKYTRRETILVILTIVAAMLLAACQAGGKNTPAPTGSETPVEPSAEPTLQPSPTPTALVGKVILIMPGDTSGEMDATRSVLEELAAPSGWNVESLPALNTSEITPDWKIVFLPQYDAALPEALAAAPQVQFVVVSEGELNPAANLSVIRKRVENQAFMAGYLSILITPDWRTAGLFSSSESTDDVIIQAFNNGAHYFCGVCNSTYSPIMRFPVVENVDTSMDWQTAINALMDQIIYAVYVSPQIATSELFDYLVQKGEVIIGGATPPEAARSRWAATVRIDVFSALRELWPDLVIGQGGKSVDSKVVIEDINEEFYSPGRQRLVEETLQDLESGAIYPLDVPLQ
jgi:hypothetical protein